MKKICEQIRKHLFELQDIKYREFHIKLVPNISEETVIGIRVPILRSYAKELVKNENIQDFLNDLPHKYYDENNLHAFIVGLMKNYELCVAETEKFLPYIDNWATCDSFIPKIFDKHTDELMSHIKKWIQSEHTYTARFAIGLLMRFYLGEKYRKEYSDMVARVSLEDYYAKMIIAWYFATALAKNYEQILPYFIEKRLPDWIHNKAIQKARESYRITDEQKEYLNTLKDCKQSQSNN